MAEIREKMKKFTFLWHIENYLMCTEKFKEAIESPSFIAESLGGSCWNLELYPRGDNDNFSDFVSLYLSRNEDDDNDVTDSGIIAYFTVDMMDASNNIIKSCSSPERRLFTKCSNWGFPDFIKIENLESKIGICSKDLLKIRCIIESKSPDISCEAKTKIGFNRFNFSWNTKVPNSFESTKFFLNKESFLDVTLTAFEDDILINIETSDTQSQFIKGKIILQNVNGIENEVQSDSYLFESIDDVWEFPNFITKRMLNDNNNSFLKTNGTFDLKFIFSVSSGTKSSVDSIYTNARYNTTDSLTKDFSEMLSSRKYTDMQLRIEGQAIPVHKSVLSARSPVFFAMFERDLLESTTGIVDILDIEYNILCLFVHFLYTGSMQDISCEDASKLLLAADKYQVQSLKEKCSEYLISAISTEIVLDLLLLGDMVGDERLKKVAFDHIISIPLEILSSSHWKSWCKNNIELGSDIIYQLTANLKKEYNKN